MRIVIDARMYRESGIGRYLRNLINKLAFLDKENEYFILLLKNEYDSLVYHTERFHKVLADLKWYGIGEQVELPKILNKLEPDLVHFPHFNVPFFYKGKFIVTIHDLIHQHFSLQRATTHGTIIYKLKQLGYKKVFLKAVINSEKILVPSNFVKDQLIRQWNIDEGKILVTHEAVDDKILTIESKIKQEEIDKVMDKMKIKPPYIFYVGNAHPHKNIEGLIKVFLILKRRYKNLSLVLSGQDNYFWKKIKSENQNNGIIYTGFVTDQELVALYKSAKAFVMPSIEEGFGIPILEAMGSSCPVISSDRGALREVGGDAALYFDPESLEDMIKKISDVLEDETLRKGLVNRGVKRVKDFSWEKLAKQTLEVYKKCVLQ